eukprot:scaffold32090_cov47-Attheya_sp.AAC.2
MLHNQMLCTLVIAGLIGRCVAFSSAQFAEADISTDGGSFITGDVHCKLPETEIDLKQLDEHWFGRTGATTCADPNQLTLQELLGDVGIKLLAKREFPHVTPLTYNEAECVLLDNGNGTFHNGSAIPKTPSVSAILKGCAPLMMPGAFVNSIFHAPEPTVDDLLRSSQGLMIDPNTNNTISMCQPDMPCKQFNKLIANGTLFIAAKRCGLLDKLLKAVKSEDLICSTQLGAQFQNTSNGLSNYCYNMLDQTTGVHGAMFGSIYWFNAYVAYLFGDLDGLGHMPGCRVKCSAHETADKGSCTNPTVP